MMLTSTVAHQPLWLKDCCFKDPEKNLEAILNIFLFDLRNFAIIERFEIFSSSLYLEAFGTRTRKFLEIYDDLDHLNVELQVIKYFVPQYAVNRFHIPGSIPDDT